MKKISNHPHPTNFWFGFALGTFAAGSAAYLLGTKKGRETLKKIVTYCEEHEEDSFEFLQKIQKFINQKVSTIEIPSGEKEKGSPQLSNIESLIDRISHVTQKKEVKKFFAKS